MGGINVYCVSFSGDDKSCSAFQTVLKGMDEVGSEPERSIIARIREDLLDEDADYLLIEPADARTLLPLLQRCAANVESQLTIPGDFLDQMARDESAAPGRETDLKYGGGMGWQAWCVRDLLRAFEVADAESEPLAPVW